MSAHDTGNAVVEQGKPSWGQLRRYVTSFSHSSISLIKKFDIKVPQRLLGPTAFPYDRLVAILGALMMEYDDHDDKPGLYIDASGVDAENGVYRVQTAAVVRSNPLLISSTYSD